MAAASETATFTFSRIKSAQQQQLQIKRRWHSRGRETEKNDDSLQMQKYDAIQHTHTKFKSVREKENSELHWRKHAGWHHRHHH